MGEASPLRVALLAQGCGAALLLAGCVAEPPAPLAPLPAPVAEAEAVAEAHDPIVPPPALPGRAFGGVAVVSLPALLPAEPPVRPLDPPAAAAPVTLPPAPVIAAPPPTPVIAAPPRPVPPPGPPAGGARVQLVAAGSETEAMRHWAGFANRHADLAAARSAAALPLERPGRSPIWRLRIGGFAGVEDANRWCAALRERGVSCWVVN